jgi:hypothetical protein
VIDVGHLPRDEYGIVQGAWRLLHRDPAYHGGVGTVDLRQGQSHEPVFGRRMVAIVSVFGGDLFLEPWGPLPPGTTLPPMVNATVSDEVLARLERCPWRDPSDIPAPLSDTLPPPPPEEPTEAAAPAEATETPAPVADALSNVADEDLEALTVDELRALAEKRGADVDARWGARRLIREIRAARG